MIYFSPLFFFCNYNPYSIFLHNAANFYRFRPSSSFRSKGQASEYENMDSDIPPEESEQNHHAAAAAVLKSPPLKPSKIPRLVSSPAKSKPQPSSKVSSALVKTSFSTSVISATLAATTPNSALTSDEAWAQLEQGLRAEGD